YPEPGRARCWIIRRQPTESRSRALARGQCESSHPRRTDARRGRRCQGGDPWTHPRSGGARKRGIVDLERATRSDRAFSPNPRDEIGRDTYELKSLAYL